MKVIHFGAGNIGRGFISPILKLDSKIEAIKFVDVNEKIVNEMNETKKYYVNELSQEINQILVTDISAILTKNLFNDENLEYLKDVNLVTTSIGENNLHFITNELIKLINLKQAQNQPLIVISAENGNRVSSYLKELIKDQVSLEQIYFVDAVVDRIVPRQKAAGLNIDVEKYYS
jgi:mannitol-1-phosphate 5-dehydrogenase